MSYRAGPVDGGTPMIVNWKQSMMYISSIADMHPVVQSVSPLGFHSQMLSAVAHTKLPFKENPKARGVRS